MSLPRARVPVALIALLLCPGLLLAQRTDPGPLADARRGIDRGNAEYIAAFARADADGVASVYDADGVRLVEDGTVLRGRGAISADVRSFVQAAGPVTVTLATIRVWLVDALAYEAGTWSYTFTPKGKPEQRVGGKYVTTWVRQADGGWRIRSDLAVPGT
ncbi:MAG: YybH family protein [Gemmatimonadales bacterium]